MIKRIEIRINEDYYNKIRLHCFKKNISMNEFIITILIDIFTEKNTKIKYGIEE